MGVVATTTDERASLDQEQEQRSSAGGCSSGGSSNAVLHQQAPILDSDEDTTLYIGGLHPSACGSPQVIEDLCSLFGPIRSCKVIKDKARGDCPAGYGFAKFSDKKSAEAALQALNGKIYMGQELRVNWALPRSPQEGTSHLFVGDLGSEVTDTMLYNAFCSVGVCLDARVMGDHHTGWSKGYGFVSFRSKEEAEAAIREMQGKQLGSRRIRVGWAQHKQDVCATPLNYDEVDRADPYNANVYIGNIAPEATEADLIEHFSVHGAVADVKLHKKGNYGFVRFEAHESAVKAIVAQHSRKLKGRMLKCSWGKNVSSARRPAPMQLQGLAATLQGLQLSDPAAVAAAAAAISKPPLPGRMLAPNAQLPLPLPMMPGMVDPSALLPQDHQPFIPMGNMPTSFSSLLDLSMIPPNPNLAGPPPRGAAYANAGLPPQLHGMMPYQQQMMPPGVNDKAQQQQVDPTMTLALLMVLQQNQAGLQQNPNLQQNPVLGGGGQAPPLPYPQQQQQQPMWAFSPDAAGAYPAYTQEQLAAAQQLSSLLGGEKLM